MIEHFTGLLLQFFSPFIAHAIALLEAKAHKKTHKQVRACISPLPRQMHFLVKTQKSLAFEEFHTRLQVKHTTSTNCEPYITNSSPWWKLFTQQSVPRSFQGPTNLAERLRHLSGMKTESGLDEASAYQAPLRANATSAVLAPAMKPQMLMPAIRKVM